MTPDEEWRPVVGYEGAYEVSNLGRVRSLPRRVPAGQRAGFRNVPARMLKLTLKPNGYYQVGLSRKSWMVHTLVARAFIGERPPGYEVCHNNGISTDNQVANLRIDTISSNRLDTLGHGTNVAANRTHCPAGHPYDETNTGPTNKGRARRCLTCHRIRENARYHRKVRARAQVNGSNAA